MPQKKTQLHFVCRDCGATSNKWLGKCTHCGTWDSLEEQQAELAPSRGLGNVGNGSNATPLHAVASAKTARLSTGDVEFDRTLGGGFAPGSLILIGGDPGVGKSTLLLQSLARMAAAGLRILYVSGEESAVQVRLRAERLGVAGSSLVLLCETNLHRVLEEARRYQPQVMAIDSVQTIYREELPGTPGSLNQLRECTLELMVQAKNSGCVTILVGHMTKDGQIAGPRVLEHMVDTVAYFEGDRNHQYRILRTTKNRFGATDEIGVFEMRSDGLQPVANPSRVFLHDTSLSHPGSVVSCTLEGSRALLFEIQALVANTHYAVAQRVAAGIDSKRLTIILALLDKFAGVHVGNSDIFVSVAGGLRVNDPGSDLALALAVCSNHLGYRLPPGVLAIGELGLSGEVRPVAQMDLRLKEAQRLGFAQVLVPTSAPLHPPKGMLVHRINRLEEAVQWSREHAP